MSTYLALTFGTLLSSQGTDASFEFASAFSPGASFFRVSSLSDPPSGFFRLALGVSNLTRSSAPLRPQEAFAVSDLTARPTC
ncbi:hypothetical protein E6W39_27640 [Kitasatospora acidiphila]|uniref:Uncharacterized protein n=1 Tax=Kitasatospora acidiphila TaxID=2567942 RepID=A0A540W8H2_9ACTN|nr:hypothetical protein E6W39_17810 [Kitasatospora acidiphila]TQF05319.1 hypothetical protein E6W39_27640 [Kitasatospora acidiphila]